MLKRSQSMYDIIPKTFLEEYKIYVPSHTTLFDTTSGKKYLTTEEDILEILYFRKLSSGPNWKSINFFLSIFYYFLIGEEIEFFKREAHEVNNIATQVTLSFIKNTLEEKEDPLIVLFGCERRDSLKDNSLKDNSLKERRKECIAKGPPKEGNLLGNFYRETMKEVSRISSEILKRGFNSRDTMLIIFGMDRALCIEQCPLCFRMGFRNIPRDSIQEE